jgi:hypothetical protein
MNRRRGFGAVTFGALCLSFAASAAWADSSPFVGRWHWNAAESKLPPGEARPADMIADIARVDPTHVQWSLTITNAQGRPAVESFDAPANGEFYPISAGTTAAFRISSATLDGTFKGPAGESDVQRCTLSADRNRMTCSGTLTDRDGKTATYVDVYDRK